MLTGPTTRSAANCLIRCATWHGSWRTPAP